MPCAQEGDTIQEETHSVVAPSKNASQVNAEIDATPIVNQGETCQMPEKAPEVLDADDTDLPDNVIGLGDPCKMLTDPSFASSVADLLEKSGKEKRAAIVTWMQPVVLSLAFSAHGTHLIQKALELTGGETQIMLSDCFHGRVRQLLTSHRGNHVLQKMIEMMPPYATEFIFYELSFFNGGWAGVARHQFGCRVVQRLLEHCDAGLTAPIVAAVVADINTLSKDPFANYVVQHILEHAPAHQSEVVNAIIQVGVPVMAKHSVASNIVECAFELSGPLDKQALAEAILSIPGAIVDMSCSRYGSFMVRQMLQTLQGTLRCMVLQQLGEAIPELRKSKPGKQVASKVKQALAMIDAGSA